MEKFCPSERVSHWHHLTRRATHQARCFQRKRKRLQKQHQQPLNEHLRQSEHRTKPRPIRDDEDPFSCSDLIVPPTQELARQKLEGFVNDWINLDSRTTDIGLRGQRAVLEQEGEEDENEEEKKEGEDQGEGTVNQEHRGPRGDNALTNWGWNAKRIRLPDYFDYACRNDRPPVPPASSSKKRRRTVVCPEGESDYETELWKLFRTVPTESNLRREVEEGTDCQRTLQLRKEIDEGLKEYTRLDCHSLSRLRKRDRHHLPREGPTSGKKCPSDRIGDTANDSNESSNEDPYQIDEPTIRVECWRKQLVRGSGCDPNRCELEFLGSQTLLEVHLAIVHLGNNVFFEYGTKKAREEAKVEKSTTEASSLSIQAEEPTGDSETEANNVYPSLSRSGVFFIEDTFYTTGDVDYATPLIKWLNGNIRLERNSEVLAAPKNSEPKTRGKVPHNDQKGPTKKSCRNKATALVPRCRRTYLGIHPSAPLRILPMEKARLSSLDLRLGVRYFHAYDGDCETAVFFTDVSFPKATADARAAIVPREKYPIVHDVWTSGCGPAVGDEVFCEGCKRRPPVVFTLEDELADGGPTGFCAKCYAWLHYERDGTRLRYNNFLVFPIEALQEMRDVSMGSGDGKVNLTMF